MKKKLLFVMILCVLFTVVSQAAVRYVKSDATGANNGTSWTDAYTSFQSALTAVVSGDQIWVAKGTYKPTTQVGGTGARYAAFQMKNGVSIYGGFAGTETLVSQRTDFGVGGVNETILSGDIGTVGNNSDNCYHVFNHPRYEVTPLTSSAKLDGFTIRDGNANASVGGYEVLGGGMFNNLSSPTIFNCNFISNRSENHGGGLYNISSSSLIVNCTFSENTSGYGGGMKNEDSNTTLYNCIFSSNQARGTGGGIDNYSCSPSIENCTFSKNYAYNNGGGISNRSGSNSVITNCIIYDNTGGGTQGIYNSSSSPTVTYSDVQGASVYAGTGNLLDDPRFADVTNDDFRLTVTSPCVNSGRNSVNNSGWDIRGEDRIQNMTIDMGAYEWTDGVDPEFPAPLLRYVTLNGAGSKNGTSWANAYDKTNLQTAINETGVTEVWVAAGTYNPTTQVGGTGTRYASFQMKNGVTIYGGFAGIENSVSQRIDFAEGGANETILSGDIGTVGTETDNCYHVFYHPAGFGLTSTAVLDGFTISGGYGVASSGHEIRGGGMYNYTNNSPTIRQCVFINNSSCLGGGIYNNGLNTNPTLENCIFKENVAHYTVSETGWGGAIYNTTKANVTIINCLIVNNTAEVTGGGIYNYSADAANACNANITNTTIASNTAVNGGGIRLLNGSDATLKNCIVWGNVSTNNGNQFLIESGCTMNLYNTCYSNSTYDVDGTLAVTTNCITSNPAFVNAPTDFRIFGISPCADAGNDSYNVLTTDVRGTGFGRKLLKTNAYVTGTIDMGSYEYNRKTDPLNGTCANPFYAGKIAGSQIICSNFVPTALSSDSLPSGHTGTLEYKWQISTTSLSTGFTDISSSNSTTYSPGALTVLTWFRRLARVTCMADWSGAVATNAVEIVISQPFVTYVTVAGAGAKNGTSWADAHDGTQLQAAINETCGQVWVAAGTYKPTTGSDRTISFIMKNGVAIYGGFSGTETNLADRNWVSNVTILSGDLLGNDGANFTNYADNSFHVIFNNNNGLNSTAILDGFTISGGNANEYGGGMYNISSSPSITNCTFTSNYASRFGGGMYNSYSSPSLSNCNLNSNKAYYYGGGIYNYNSNPGITNCTFNQNSTSYDGGGMYNSYSSPNLTNCIFSTNTVSQYGGGIYNYNSNPGITNCTFSRNSASSGGGGVHTYSDTPSFTNCIVWGNSGGGMQGISGSATVTYSIIQGASVYPGTGNLLADPLFADAGNPAGPDGIYCTADDGISIQCSSPAINAGNPATTTPVNDITGFTRTGFFDMGAYESLGFTNPADGGEIQEAQTICEGTVPAGLTNKTTPTGYTGILQYKWQSSTTSASAGFTDIITAATGTGYSPGALTVTTWYKRLVKVICQGTWLESNVVQITVSPTTLGGSVLGSIYYNSTPNSTALTLTGHTGNVVRWEYSTNDWAAITTVANTTNTLTATNIATTTKYRAVVKSGVCSEVNSAEATITFREYLIKYVTVAGAGAKNGTSWADAYEASQLQTAIYAFGVTDVWVAAGTYKPTTSSDRTISFIMKNFVAIYGGFSGTETVLSQRNIATNVTILSGDLLGDDGANFANNGDNSYHVIYNNNNGLNSTAILDGFTIKGGNANDANNSDYWNGGGMFNKSSSPSLTNCTFSGNSGINGGGMFNSTSSPSLTNCTFNANSTSGLGGGIYNINTSNPSITNCTFSANSALSGGGGMVNYSNCNPVIRNCIVWGNTEGIYNNSGANPVITYSIIEGASVYPGAGNLLADPKFVDAAGNDLRLYGNSPAVNNGNNAANASSTDIRGQARIQNTTIDMGAYEWTNGVDPAIQPPQIVHINYVTQTGSGSKNGTSWVDAYDKTQLQTAINETGVTSVWVAAGTYKPTTGSDRTISFIMKNRVAIYGGFSGSETNLSDRNWTTNVTILSGDLLGNDGVNFTNYDDNSYSVIYNNQNWLNSTAILDGFTIKGGNSLSYTYGGGMTNYYSHPSINNCTFSANSAYYYGGGIYNSNSSPNITNCNFSANTTRGAGSNYGGGICNRNSSPNITNCTFSANTTSGSTTAYGGGISNYASYPNLINCTFTSNTAAIEGGGMYNLVSNPTLTNCTFNANSTSSVGGGIYNNDSDPKLTNCTLSANLATYNGGGMHNHLSSSPSLNNCIVWGNTGGGTQGISNSSSTPSVTYSIIQGASVYTGTGNLLADPKFVNAAGNDFRLYGNSPAVNTGNNAANVSSTDIRGQVRIQNTTIDMGAYEWTSGVDPRPTITWTGSTSTNWNTSGNWNLGTVPTYYYDAVIPNVTRDPVVNEASATPAICNNLSVASGAVLTIASGKALTVSGTLTNSAGITGLVIQSASDASTGTGSLKNNTEGVPATVERWMSGDLWHLISPAATGGETVASFVGTGTQNANLIARNAINFGLAPYNETTDEWDYYKIAGTNSGYFGTSGKGYQILRANGAGTGTGNAAYNGTVSFKGTLGAADVSIGITKTVNHFGWNLVGNPYPCAMDVSAFLTANAGALDDSYEFIYVANMADKTGGYQPNTDSPVVTQLASGEAFFVKSKIGGGTINFTTAMKTHVSDAFKSAVIQNGFNLIAASGSEKRRTTVKYIPQMTAGLDPGWDAGLFYNGDETSFSLFTALVEDNGVDFTIQCLPDNDYENLVVPVGITAQKGETVEFSLADVTVPVGYKVFLEDRVNRKFTRLDEQGSIYSVQLNANSAGTGQFFLHTKQEITGIKDAHTNPVLVIPVPQQHLIRVSGLVNLPAQATVYDINGRTITIKTLTSVNENEIQLNGVSNGIYLLKIKSGTATTQHKISWTL